MLGLPLSGQLAPLEAATGSHEAGLRYHQGSWAATIDRAVLEQVTRQDTPDTDGVRVA